MKDDLHSAVILVNYANNQSMPALHFILHAKKGMFVVNFAFRSIFVIKYILSNPLIALLLHVIKH